MIIGTLLSNCQIFDIEENHVKNFSTIVKADDYYFVKIMANCFVSIAAFINALNMQQKIKRMINIVFTYFGFGGTYPLPFSL